MAKHLYVGDPHVQVSDIHDCGMLLNFVLATAKKEKVDRIVLLGDLHHCHDVKRVTVEDFWREWFEAILQEFPGETFVLCGNHDMANQKDIKSPNALTVYKDKSDPRLVIVEEPYIHGNILYMPYVHDNETFLKIVNDDSGLCGDTNVLVCHATFDGASENGFYMPNGIDPNLVKQKQIISGHIHSESSFGKVWYPGTARWMTAADANKAKGIWVCEHDDSTGLMTSKTFYSTYGVCSPITSVVWNEGEEEPKMPERGTVSVELIGSSTFVNKAKVQFKGKAKIKTKVTDKVIRENRKSSQSILDFLDNVYKTGVNRDKLKAYLIEKNYA